MKKLGIYLRVSTETQVGQERYSIPIQREDGKKFALENGFEYEIFEDYKSGSGTLERTNYLRLFQKIESGEIDGVWIAKIDRFSRDTVDGLTAIKTLREKNCRFWVASVEQDIFDYNTELLFSMQFAFASFERRQIRSRTEAGKKRARNQGNRVVVDMLGWDRYVSADGIRSVKQNPDEVKIVQLIFNDYLAGRSIPEIQRKLLDAGYRSKYAGRVYHYKNGEEKPIEDRWGYSTIKQILSHPEHTGLTYDASRTELLESKKYLPRIIEREDWHKVQRMLSVKKYDTDHKTGWRIVSHFASGLLTCGTCGAKYYFINMKGGKRKEGAVGYYYYLHKKLTPVQVSCPTKATMLPWKDVEDFLEMAYLNFFSEPERLRSLYDSQVREIAKDKEELEKDEARLSKALEENARKSSNLVRAITMGIDLAEITDEVESLKREKSRLEAELRKRRRDYAMKTESRDDLMDQFTIDNITRFMSADGQTKRAMMRTIFKSVTISDQSRHPSTDGAVDKVMKIEMIVGACAPINFNDLTEKQSSDLTEFRAGTKYTIDEILKTRKTWDDYVRKAITATDLDKNLRSYLRGRE